MAETKGGVLLREALRVVGIVWIGLVVAAGAWLGFAGLFLNQGGIIFESGFGDIWILAICAAPGYFFYVFGGKGRSENTEEHQNSD